MPMILNFCNCNQKAAILTIKVLQVCGSIAYILLVHYNACFDFYLFDDVHSTNLQVFGYLVGGITLIISFTMFCLTLWGKWQGRKLYVEEGMDIFASFLYFALFTWMMADMDITLYEITPVDFPLDFVPVKNCFGVDLTTWVTAVFNITIFGVDAYVVLEIIRKRSGTDAEEFYKPPSKKDLKDANFLACL